MLITASERFILTPDTSAPLCVKVYHLGDKKIMEIRDKKVRHKKDKVK
jgi:hypothetical protein